MKYQANVGELRRGMLLLALLVLCFTACKVLKHRAVVLSDSIEAASTFALIQHRDSAQVQQSRIRVEAIDSRENLAAELIPEGVFSYSAADGFRGMAKSVKILATSSRNESRKDSENLKAVAVRGVASTTESHGRSRVTKKLAEKEAKRSNWKLWCMVAGGALVVAVWLGGESCEF